MGSTLEARRAGIQLAIRATVRRRVAAPMMLRGSVGWRP